MYTVESPVPQYFDTDGSPLNGGYIYFGTANQNPETSPVAVYWDAAGTQPAAQPLRTANGYIMRGGAPANVYAVGDYSVSVKNPAGVLVFYVAASVSYANTQAAVQPLWSRARRMVLASDYDTLQHAYDALPTTGGTVYVPQGWTETLTANLVLSKKYCGFVFMGGATITMGVYSVVVTAGTLGAFITSIGNGQSSDRNGQDVSGAFFAYTGTTKAFDIGDATTNTEKFSLSGVSINIEYGGAGSIALSMRRTIFVAIDGLTIKGSGGGIDNMECVRLDGTGDYCGFINMRNVVLAGAKYHVRTLGQVNLVSIVGGGISSSISGTGTFGISREGSGVGFIVRDFEIGFASIAVNVASGHSGDNYELYVEGNTYDVNFAAGATANRVTILNDVSPSIADGNGATTTNAVTTVSKVAGSNIYLPNSGYLWGRTAANNTTRLAGVSGADHVVLGSVDQTVASVDLVNNSVNLATFTAAGMSIAGPVGTLQQGPTLSITANVIAPTKAVSFLGAGLVKTITVPTHFVSLGGTLTIIPTAAFTTDATVNIAIASTATIGRAMTFTYDGGTSKWYPSY